MANVTLQIRQDIDINSVDSFFEVSGADGKLGDLAFSKGTVDWWPSDKSVNCKSFTWEQLATLLTDNGKPKRKKRPKRK